MATAILLSIAKVEGPMQSIRLGLEAAPDFLAKARRELLRFKSFEDSADKADHALNLALTIGQLGKWTYHHGIEQGVSLGGLFAFIERAHNSNASVKLLHKIAGTTKHHTSSRRIVLEIKVSEVGPCQLTIQQFDLGIDDWQPQTHVAGSRLLGIRSLIKDNEIVGLESAFEGLAVTEKRNGLFFDPVCEDAIGFWSKTILELEAGRQPPWLSCRTSTIHPLGLAGGRKGRERSSGVAMSGSAAQR
ncbi:hypothetical protein [Pararhodobacter oceanensis]|uniref:hypothetical protein n=1 Tax=Pararhodobacter oceanensis TaxID=2172121 RepID=UPI0010579020|nr:hypothetical protein [Pararhodobacter oceanensis]